MYRQDTQEYNFVSLVISISFYIKDYNIKN